MLKHSKVATAELSVQLFVMSNVSVILPSDFIHHMQLGLFTSARVSHINSSGRLTECAQGMGQSIACGGGVDSGTHPN